MISKGKNIGIDGRVLLSQPHGGIGEYTARMIRELAALAPHHSFHVFLNAAKNNEVDASLSTPANVQVHRFFYPNKFFNFSQRFLGQPKLDAMLGDMDVWWSPHFLPSAVSCPKVLTVHDLSFFYYPEFFDMRRRMWHSFISPKRQAQGASKIIAVSESTARDIEGHWGIPQNDIAVVRSGVGVEFHAGYNEDEKKKVRKVYALPENFILTLGTMEPRKNILGTLRAFEEFRSKFPEYNNVHLVIAGSSGWSSRELYRRVARSPFHNDIHCIGFVKQEDKAPLYSMASAFVYPSFFEGFGFPPLEAMACGVPTIVSNTSSLPEVVGDAAILIDPWRLEEIVFALKEIFTDKELVAHLRKQGIVQAKKFSWEEAARKTLAVLEGAAVQKDAT